MPELSALMDGLERACRALRQNEATIGWEWEERFDAALSVFQAENSTEVRGVLAEHFKTGWDAGKLAAAPADLQQLVRSLGGLRAGQELLTSDPDLDLVVAVALWPWGGGAKISMRLWLLSRNVSDDEKEKLRTRFRGWFQ